MLPEGHRLHVVLEGITRGFTAVNIRKFLLRAHRLSDLVSLGSLTPQAARFLEASVRAGLNILVAGGTQAGKTTMLNCLAAAVPGGERVVSAEEVFELRFSHPDWVAMQTRQAGLEQTGEIVLRDLVKEALRMRPSRILVGEVRAAECLDLLLALNSGLPGMCTLHANSAREALVKMCTLPLLAGDNISARFVVPTVATSVDLVVHLGLGADGVRRVNEIVSVPGRVEADVIEVEPIFVRHGRRAAAHRGSARARRALRAGRHRRPPAARLRGGRSLMGALVGLGVGVGLLLIWSAFALPRRPRSTTPTSTALGRLLGRAGLADVTPASVLSLCAVLFAVAFALVQAVSRTVPVAVVFAAMAAYLPIAVLRQRAARRLRDFAEVWPEAVDNLASAVRAGLSLPDAVAALGTNGPEALRADFAQFALDYQVTGRFGECLDRLKDRLADPVGDRVIEGLRLAREVGGGDLGRLLRNLSGFLRDDARTRSELESRQAWTVNGARLAVAAPWIVLLLMSFQTTAIRQYASPGGVLVLGIGFGVCVLAYWAMMRIGRLPTEKRILS